MIWVWRWKAALTIAVDRAFGAAGEMSARERRSDEGWRQERIGSRGVEPDCWEGPKLGLAAGFEGLDNDHAPAAARTRVPRLVFVSTRGVIALAARRAGSGAPRSRRANAILAAAGIGEEAIVADAV